MSGPDALTDLLRRHDRPLAPSPDFADRLEARLLAELDPTASARDIGRPEPVRVQARPRGVSGSTVGRRPRWLDTAAAAVLVIGVLGGMLSQLTVGDDGGRVVDPPGTIAAPDFLSMSGDEPEVAAMEGGSPARDNRFAGPGPTEGELVERWVAPDPETEGQPVHLQVVPFGDTVYRVMGEGTWDPVESTFVLGDFAVSAHRLDTGAAFWGHPTMALVGVAVAQAGVVAVVPGEPEADGSMRSRLALLDHATGREVWGHTLAVNADANRRSPIVTGETVYYVDADATVYALDLETGVERWVSRAASVPATASEPCLKTSGICGFGGFAIGDGALYVFNAKGVLMALDLVDGSARWQVDAVDRYGLPTRPIAFLTVVAGGVVLNLVVDATDPVTVTQEGRFVRLDGATGADVWERRITAQVGFAAVSDGERLFVGQSDELGGCCAILALDLASGEDVWASDPTRVVPLGMVDGDLIAVLNGSISGNQPLYALDSATGEERWRQLVPAGRPSLPLAHDGTMLVVALGAFDAPSGLFAYRSAIVGSQVAAVKPAVMEGGSAARDNRWAGPAQGLTAGELEERWTVQLSDGQLIPGVSPLGDMVYTVTPRTDGPDVRVEARDVATGAVRWAVDAGPAGPWPAVSEAGVLLLESGPGDPGASAMTVTLRMLDPATGAERWRYAVGPTTIPSLLGPLVAGGTVYHVDGNGVAYALDAATGAERWVSRTARAFPATKNFDCGVPVAVCNWGSFALGDGVLYLVNGAAEVYALDAATGTAIWKVEIGERYALERASVTVMATDLGVVLNVTIASEEPDAYGYHQAVASRTALLDRQTGNDVWTRGDVGDLTGAASDGERLFLHNVPDSTGCCAMIALDLATGATDWTIGEAYGYPLGLVGGERPALVRVDARHEEQVFIVGIDPVTGGELWRLETDKDYPLLPVAADGTLFALESDGSLTAFRVIPAPIEATPAAPPEASPVASPVATPVAGESEGDGFEVDHVVSAGEAVNLRSEPTTGAGGATIIGVVTDGTPLRATGRTAPADSPDNGPWIQVELEDGTVGWLREVDVSRTWA